MNERRLYRLTERDLAKAAQKRQQREADLATARCTGGD